MKCIIHWDKRIFDGEKRLLPSIKCLYTQIYLHEKKQAWSIVFKFDISPREQGYKTIANEVAFLVKEAPKEILKEGFEFDFMDGGNKVGKCILFE